MQLILIGKPGRAPRRLHLGPAATRAAFAAAILVGALLVAAGMQFGGSPNASAPEAVFADWRHQIETQKRTVDLALRSAEENLGALALRMGQMQAQLIRLEALGQRLTEMSGLDQGEFDFGSAPALGGPAEPSALQAHSVPDFLSSLDTLSAQLDGISPKLRSLESALMQRQLDAEVRPSGRPVRKGWISSYYGYRTDPITGKKAFHDGIDFAGKRTAKVYAVASGVVVWSGRRHGYGQLVEINHGNGYVTRYAHNSKNLVQAGDTVRRGEPVALMGSTGRSTGPHVHFEVLRNGKAVNPLRFVQEKS